MNIRQAFKHMTQSNIDVVLTCKYHNRIETHEFDHEDYDPDHEYARKQYAGFEHLVKCIKQDFADMSTLYSGNKSDCEYVFSAA